MSRLRRGSSLWLHGEPVETPPTSRLRGRHDIDVAVVGGGITGCAVARHLAHAGLGLILIDAGHLAHGSTAASTALLMQEPDADFRRLAKRYGAAVARDIWRMSQRAVRSLVRTLERSPGAPPVEKRASVYFTSRADEVAALQRELAARRRAGLSGAWLTAAGVRRLAGVAGAGGIVTRGNAQVDPYRACLALARAARAAGASLHEHTRARAIAGRAGGVVVRTPEASIHARWVVIATGYATEEFRPLAGRFRLSDTYVLATPPLNRATRDAIGLGEAMIWDTERPYHYARWTADDRLLFGGHDQPHRRKTAEATIARRIAALRLELRQLYPATATIEPEYAWEGLFATTPDGLPYIGRHHRYPQHLFALGYGGNGMTFGFLAAQIIARAILGRQQPGDDLFGFGRLR